MALTRKGFSMPSKYTAIFELSTNNSNTAQGHRVGGWSETVYYNGSVNAVNIAQFTNLCQRRARFLPASAAVVGQRYQNIDPVGGASTGSVRFPGNANYGNDVPQMSLLCRI